MNTYQQLLQKLMCFTPSNMVLQEKIVVLINKRFNESIIIQLSRQLIWRYIEIDSLLQ